MIDSYIILNRKVNFIIKIFIFNVLLLTILVIWCINTLQYQSFFHIHSQILKINSFYYLEVLIPVKEVNLITNQNKIIFDSKEYHYQVYEIVPEVIYYQNDNCQKVYLEIHELEDIYKIDGYRVEVKIKKKNQKIINYFI